MLNQYTQVHDIPKNVPIKKGGIGTPSIGEAMLMNQLGIIGVIRRNMI